ncbi:hypothetical protein N9K96_00140 [bacterium]|nr:hypothetical protein [bacterium]
MKIIYLTFLLFLLTNCNKPKAVLICGDHICINKTEAEQFFEENLSLEVKIIDKKIKKEVDLIELNLKEKPSGERKITLLTKKDTLKELKTLSNDEKEKIKKNIINKKKKMRAAKKKENNVKKADNKKNYKNKNNTKKSNKNPLNSKIMRNNNNKKSTAIVDVCTILDKCNIDEISKFLLEQGRKKRYPDITIRE